MNRYAAVIATFFLSFVLVLAAQAQTVTVNVTGVHSSKGSIAANLCDDPKAPFPGACGAYRSVSPAMQGTTGLTFKDVKPGSYALQLFHDEDGNNFPNIPPEGFAYGNDQQFPPDFAKSSFKVEGDTAHTVRMIYLTAPAAAPQGQKGAPAPTGVTKTDVRENGLYGEFYMPKSDKPLPALIVMSGSDGGINVATQLGVGFTRHGYAVLSLAYFMEQGLPQTVEDVPLEYFDKAVGWVKKQPGVDPQALGAIGGSRGSEAALLLAARNKDVRAVMAFAPSGIVWQGLDFNDVANMGPAWTADGKPLPFIAPDAAAYRPKESMTAMFDNVLAEADRRPETQIPVEKINGPVLLISGADDRLWPSADMAARIVKRLKDKGFEHDVTNLVYEGAGHLVFMGDSSAPYLVAQGKAGPNPVMGGDGPANAKAWNDNWPKTVAFFDETLKGMRR
jgi:dienelactone hydrolase/uncharacterized protein (DUF2141 family)